MAFTEKDIEKLAQLARIELTADAKKKFAKQVASILEYVEQIKEVDTSKVKEVSHLPKLRNAFREDKVRPASNVNKSIDQFPDKSGNLNKVKAVLDNSDH